MHLTELCHVKAQVTLCGAQVKYEQSGGYFMNPDMPVRRTGEEAGTREHMNVSLAIVMGKA